MYRSHIECLPCINTDSFPSLPKQLLRPLMWSHHTSHIKLVMILIINNFLTLCNKRLCLYHFSRLFTAQTDPLLPQTGASHHRSVWANTELWPSPPCQVLKANLDQNALLITEKNSKCFSVAVLTPPHPFPTLKRALAVCDSRHQPHRSYRDAMRTLRLRAPPTTTFLALASPLLSD